MRPRLQRLVSLAFVYAASAYALLACSYSALIKPLNRDEHQFLAGAALVARAGLQPYRDFAYFHVPNLVYLYAPFCWMEHPFFWARLFNGVCALALCAIIFCMTRSRWTRGGDVIAAAAIILFCNSETFQFTAGKIWNHSSGTLCALVATLALLRGWVFTSGFALGLALGIRLSFAPLVIPFLLALIFGAPKWRRLLVFGVGGLLANLPSLYFCLTSGENFFFDQIGYRKLVALYTEATSPGPENGMVRRASEALQLCRSDPALGLILIVAVLGTVAMVVAMRRRGTRVPSEFGLLLSLIPFLLIGSLAPLPVHEQFVFQLVPFCLLLGLISLAIVPFAAGRRIGIVIIFCGATASFFQGGHLKDHVAGLGKLRQPNRWTPPRVARAADEIRAAITHQDGPVLTLSPIYAIEAGLPLVKEFATGPFAWRVSRYVSAEEAARRKMPWAPGIVDFLRSQPLRAVVTGQDRPKHENELVAALKQAGYGATTIADDVSVWRKEN